MHGRIKDSSPSSICPDADIYTHCLRMDLRSIAARVANGRIHVFQHETLLHVHDACLYVRNLETGGVEQLRCGHERAILWHNLAIIIHEFTPSQKRSSHNKITCRRRCVPQARRAMTRGRQHAACSPDINCSYRGQRECPIVLNAEGSIVL